MWSKSAASVRISAQPIKLRIEQQLARAYQLVSRDDRRSVLLGMNQLCRALAQYRQQTSKLEWTAFCRNTLFSHHIAKYIFSDPYTRRSFEKPYNYPGDAVLLDYIYRKNPLSELVHIQRVSYIHEYCVNSLASRAVRYRASVISNYIDSVNLKVTKSHVLSVACGHLRELQSVKTINRKPLDAFIALDHEDRCYPIIMRDNPDLKNFRFYQTNVLDMIKSDSAFPAIGYDFIYSAGLFDYLSDKISEKLILRLFRALNKGGVLLVTNFAPNIADLGYMESFMDWHLIYRTELDLLRLSQLLQSVASIRTFLDPYSNIAYLEVVKL